MLQYKFIQHPRYKYELVHTYRHDLEYFDPWVAAGMEGGWVRLDNGRLYIRSGYAWNGADVAIDTPTNLRASLVHDAMYQLIAMGHLRKRPWKRYADREYLRIAGEDGMDFWRRIGHYIAIRLGGGARGKYRP